MAKIKNTFVKGGINKDIDYRLLGQDEYRDALNIFDQMMFTKPFIDKDFSTFKIYKTGIYNPSYMTAKKGRYKGYPKRSFVGATWTDGYSDHFPVYTYLIKEVN